MENNLKHVSNFLLIIDASIIGIARTCKFPISMNTVWLDQNLNVVISPYDKKNSYWVGEGNKKLKKQFVIRGLL